MMRFKRKGVTLAATAIAIIAWMFLGYIAFIVMASPFSVLASARTARQAEQYAEFVASSLKLVDYDDLATAAHARRSLAGEIAGANGWESSVSLSAESSFGASSENVQRIATVDIFRTGDTLSRFTLQVPLSSAGTGAAESGGDNLPVGTILPYKGAIKDIPEKWALCDGNHGTPNLSGRFLEGVTSSPGSTKSAGLPNITGSFGVKRYSNSSSILYADNDLYSGALSRSARFPSQNYNGIGATASLLKDADKIIFDAHNSNSIYGNSSTVQPASYTVLYIMKIKA